MATGRSLPDPLPVEALYRACRLDDLAFETTDALPDLEHPVGQDRAVEALHFGSSVQGNDFNLYVMGPSGIGKHAVTRRLLEQRARQEPVPEDRCYVYNFAQPGAPRLITLRPGDGHRLAAALDQLCEELESAIPAIFESDEYQSRLQELQRTFGRRQEQAIGDIQKEADAHGIALIVTPGGFTFAPEKNGEPIDHEAFEALPDEERAEIERVVKSLQEKLQRVVQQFPKWRKETQQQLQALNEEMAQIAIGQSITDLRERFRDNAAVVDHLDAIRADVVDHVDALRRSDDHREMAEPIVQRYRANVLVANDGLEGAPVVYEDLPTYHHLLGRIEHRVVQGALITDFSLIQPGALHRANGGYLMIDVLKLLTQPFAWEALKRSLQSQEIRIESLEQMFSVLSTVSLQPQPVPLQTKVILLGDRLLYYLLAAWDPDFASLFKVEADFEDDIEREPDSQDLYARMIATVARRDGVRPLDRSGVARVIEHAARLAGDSERLSMHARSLADLLREADHHAGRDDAPHVATTHVQAAIDAVERRASRVRERLERAIQRDTIHIETDGAAVGQVNGLAVMQLGNYAFGKGSRITATARLGTGRLIDIERESKLGGNIHSKAVMIIGNYIGWRYAADRPLSLHASLAFEQNYGGVEGDSASVAEVCALLSAIANTPLSQALAVTGSIDQHGRVQAVGGINEKIEGFFETCEHRGLAEGQGILMPRANVPHLMLRQSVRDAVADGRFRIVAIDHVDQALELLVGLPAGERGDDGNFPEGSFNERVDNRLTELLQARREMDRLGESGHGDEEHGDAIE